MSNSQSNRHSLKGKRDKDAYDALCKQIEREENLNSFRLNVTLVVNLALGTGFITQLQSSSDIVLKSLSLAAISGAACLFTLFSGASIWAGRKQISYLKDDFLQKEDTEFYELVRPFYWTNSSNDNNRERFWNYFPLIIAAFWILALILGIFLAIRVPVNKELECKPTTTTSSSSAQAPAAMSRLFGQHSSG